MKQETQSGKQPQRTPGTAQPQTKSTESTVNLYEPYVTPPLLYHTVRWLAAFVFHLFHRVTIRGLHNVPRSGAFILASNHLSWTDIPLIPSHLDRKVVYMAKEEYFNGRMRWLVRVLGAFPVRRGEADRQALRAGVDQLKKGNILVIFPEGTRSRTRTLAKAHPGMGMIALRSGVPVVPVAVWGSENVLKKIRAPVTIVYGKPLIFQPKGTKLTREDIDDATATVMHSIAAMLPPSYRGFYADV